jgi:hypothetical protein
MRTRKTVVSGILTPFMAVLLGVSLAALAISAPFWTTLLLASLDRCRAAFGSPLLTVDGDVPQVHRVNLLNEMSSRLRPAPPADPP